MLKIISHLFLICCASLLTGCIGNHAVPVENLNNAPPISAKADQNQQVVLLVPEQGDFGHAGQVVRDGFLAGYKQANSPSNVQVKVMDTESSITPNVAYQSAAADNPNLVIGPLTKPSVAALSLLASLPVPTLALNQSDPNAVAPLNLFQFSLNPQSDAQAVASKMIQSGLSKVIVISQKGDWGQGIASSFGQTWLAQQAQIVDSLAYDANDDFKTEIQSLVQNHSVDDLQSAGIFLVASASDVAKILPVLKAALPTQPIYSLPIIFDGNNQAQLESINFPLSPWMLHPENPLRQAFQAANPTASGQDLNLYAFGLDAYLLAQYHLKTGGFEGLALQGNSGYLTMGTNGVIHRGLTWVTVTAGKIVTK